MAMACAFTSASPIEVELAKIEYTAGVLAGFVSFMITFTYYCISEVARDLEDPFIHFPNELPLA
eukprot:CAMPEP_0173108568 /NCGR_PEP_ID=MMETSP1102-20130122/42789_1 /TAXON_ID=49646 /ORGANISM="Geminigera sp., Strain Caron Lab Isolate" /LENGTH=63 /DNA_ID=CAMNT_0014007051 /DNA_START=1 /DNA_END=188 /DNA_ORIENTATION=+